MMDRIIEIIADCDSIQESGESAYTKEQAKITAYDEIREIVRESEDNK